jgi:hypothetical protein
MKSGLSIHYLPIAMKNPSTTHTRKSVALLATILVSLSALSPVAQAHHAFAAEFDGTKPIEVKGIITKVTLTNPHSWIYVDAKDASGKTVNWGFEFGAPFALAQKGLTRSTVSVGAEVTLRGFLSKNGQAFGYSTHIVLPDGRTIQTGGAPDAPVEPVEPAKS